MSVQSATDYTTEHGAAVAGAVVDGQVKNIRSGVVTSGALGFGRFCGLNAGIATPIAAGLIAAGLGGGFVVRTQDDVANSSDVLQKEIGSTASILDFGEVWVETDEAVATTDSVFVRIAGGNVGMVRSDVDTADAEALPNARFVTATAGAGLVKVVFRR